MWINKINNINEHKALVITYALREAKIVVCLVSERNFSVFRTQARGDLHIELIFKSNLLPNSKLDNLERQPFTRGSFCNPNPVWDES